MIYSVYGYGKGKTEASIGIAVRALANDEKVLYMQFLKDGSSGEIEFLKRNPNFEYQCTNTAGFGYTDEDSMRCAKQLLDITTYKPEVKLIVLDEILVAYDLGFVPLKYLKEVVKHCKDNNIDVCMTGRINSKDKRLNIVTLSDIVTNAFAVKHWFNTYCPECKCEYEYHYKYCPKCGTQLQESKPSKKGRDF